MFELSGAKARFKPRFHATMPSRTARKPNLVFTPERCSELAGKLICSHSHLVRSGINHEEAFKERAQPCNAIRKVIAEGADGHRHGRFVADGFSVNSLRGSNAESANSRSQAAA